MSQFIAITDEEGKRREYRIPAFGEFTVAEWLRLCLPINEEKDDRQRLDEDLRRMTGIPKTAWRRLRESERDKLVDAYVQLRIDAANRQQEVDAIDFRNPDRITHEGTTYAVPKDIDNEVTVGQWADLISALDKATHEPEVYAAICGILLVPEGKEYDGPLTETMQTLPVRIALGVVAFFSGRSKRLRSELIRYSMLQATSRLRGLLPEGQPSIPDTPQPSTS